jgi:hypothetical protein
MLGQHIELSLDVFLKSFTTQQWVVFCFTKNFLIIELFKSVIARKVILTSGEAGSGFAGKPETWFVIVIINVRIISVDCFVE